MKIYKWKDLILAQSLDLDATGKNKSASPVSLQQHLVIAEQRNFGHINLASFLSSTVYLEC